MADIPKVQRNIRRMIDGGASEQEIDAYLQHEGVSIEQLQGQAAPQMAQQPAEPDIVHRGALWPIDIDAEGGRHLNWESGLPGMVGRAFSLANDVGSGEVPVFQGDVDTGRVGISPQLVERTSEAAGLMTPMSPAAGSGRAISAARGAGGSEPRVPTRGDLHAAGSAGFNAARGMGVDYDPAFIAQFASVARAKLEEAGFNPLTAKNTFKVLRDLERPGPTVYAQVSGLHAAQQALRKGSEASDRDAGEFVVKALQRFMEDPPPQAVLSGPAREAGQILREAQGNWAALERSKEVAGKERRAQLRAWAAGSGANMDNSLRQRVTDLLLDEKALRGFTKEEIKRLEDFVKGTKGRNASRKIANVLGGGGGLGTLLTGSLAGGAAAGGYPAALTLPAIGVSAKVIQNILGRRGMREVDEAIRMRSPAYGTQAMPPLPPVRPGMLSRAGQRLPLMMLQSRNGGGGY